MREVIFNDFTSGIQCDKIENFGKGTDKNSQNLHSNTANLNHSENPHPTPPQDFVIFASVGEILADCTSGKQKSSRDKKADTTKQITLHSKYGSKKATFETTSASIMLPFTKGGEYFVFDDVRFFVIAGEGALYYLDCVKAYDFENLEAEYLEQFLLTGKQPRDYKQRELIKDFLYIDTKNIQKGKMYLLPKDYEALQIRIMGGFVYDS
ncbi:hypothetical protein [Helicobacter labetoulli]|uniref:hypothetical protein n=1 Tax=Helicobacter labetoulli TaxID=2315333 RepID=UPI000EF64838|nr:hypothetical protein [Helicobacter labetoulli]